MKRIAILMLVAGMVISSCNMPTSEAAEPDIATAAALTVEAALNNATPLASPTAASSTQTVGTAEITPIFSDPLASFEDVTNCRTGPGVTYERVTQLPAGLSVKLIGFFPPSYWIVESDKGPCWVAGEFVTPSGSYASIPTVTAPPTPTGEPPADVSLQKWDISCNYSTNEADVTIIWIDKEGVSGYRVVRNDIIIAELSLGTTEFKEQIFLASGQSVSYYIIAFNAVGVKQSKTIMLSC